MIKYLVFLISLSYCSYGQKKNIFNIVTLNESKLEFSKKIDSTSFGNNFYEDEKYIVSKTCNGEWGGTIIFKNKALKTEFICGSTCPVTITKHKGKYIITNSLTHLLPQTQILEIVNPELLKKTFDGRNKIEGKKVDETLGRKGAKIILHKYHYGTLYSFVYQDKIYHIVSSLMIKKLSSQKLKMVSLRLYKNYLKNSYGIIKPK